MAWARTSTRSSTGAFKVGLSSPTRATRSRPLVQGFADLLNKVASTGYSKWEVGATQSIFGKTLVPFGLVEGEELQGIRSRSTSPHGMLFWGARRNNRRARLRYRRESANEFANSIGAPMSETEQDVHHRQVCPGPLASDSEQSADQCHRRRDVRRLLRSRRRDRDGTRTLKIVTFRERTTRTSSSHTTVLAVRRGRFGVPRWIEAAPPARGEQRPERRGDPWTRSWRRMRICAGPGRALREPRRRRSLVNPEVATWFDSRRRRASEVCPCWSGGRVHWRSSSEPTTTSAEHGGNAMDGSIARVS